MQSVIAIVSSILVLSFVKGKIDIWQHKRKKKINHRLEWFALAIVFGLFDWIVGLHWTALPIQCAGTWLVFDVYFACLLDKSPFFLGTEAWSDRTFRRLFPGWHEEAAVLLKVLFLGVSIFLYVRYC